MAEKRVDRLRKSEEREDSPDVVHRKVTRLARLIQNAEHTIVYTGAGNPVQLL